MTTAAKSTGRAGARKAPPKVAVAAVKRAPTAKPALTHKAVVVGGKAKLEIVSRKHRDSTFIALVNSGLAGLFAQVKDGLPPEIVDAGADYLGVSKNEFVDVLQIPSSTLSRWRQRNQPMPPAESDRVARIARVALIVEEALGSREEAVAWLNSQIPALGNVKPLAMLGSDSGVKIVEDLLVRAQAGVYG